VRLDPSDLRPVYRQVADDLRRAITSGKYPPGERLPSGRVLAREYGIAPMTVASALSLLRDEGLIASWQGRGVYVLEPAQHPAPAAASPQRLASLEADVASLRRHVSALDQQVADLYGKISAPRPATPHEPADTAAGRPLPDYPAGQTRRQR